MIRVYIDGKPLDPSKYRYAPGVGVGASSFGVITLEDPLPFGAKVTFHDWKYGDILTFGRFGARAMYVAESAVSPHHLLMRTDDQSIVMWPQDQWNTMVPLPDPDEPLDSSPPSPSATGGPR